SVMGTNTDGMVVVLPCSGSCPASVYVSGPILYWKTGAVPCAATIEDSERRSKTRKVGFTGLTLNLSSGSILTGTVSAQLRPYSSLKSWDGSTLSARRAGMADAARPSSAIVNTAPHTTTGSLGFAWYTICLRKRVAANAAD